MKRLFLNLKIHYKILLETATISVLLIVGTLVGFMTTYLYRNLMADQYNAYLVPAGGAAEVALHAERIQVALNAMALAPQVSAAQIENVTALRTSAAAELKKFTTGAGEKGQGFLDAWNVYDRAVQSALTAYQKGGGMMETAAAEQLLIQLRSSYDKTYSAILESAKTDYDNADKLFQFVAPGLILSGLFGLVVAISVGLVVGRSIVGPLHQVGAKLRRLSVGDINEDIAAAGVEDFEQRNDEIGELARDAAQLHNYLHDAMSVARAVAAGDLTTRIETRGEQDVLGNALAKMIQSLMQLIRQMQQSAGEVEGASTSLKNATAQTSAVVTQVTTTIQQVAQGISDQAADMNQTMGSVERAQQSIEEVSNGAATQQRSIDEVRQLSDEMNAAIHNVMATVTAVAGHANDSSEKARSGTQVLSQTVNGVRAIDSQVTQLSDKITKMSERSEEIGEILNNIEEIATKTNILAINAAIEAAHAGTSSRRMIEEILGQMMAVACQMVNGFLKKGFANESPAFWKELAAQCGLDTILVTDGDGLTTICNEDSLVGWRFPDDPGAQTLPFRALLNQKDGVVNQDSQARSFDKQVFKYVGVSRADLPGIVQVGYNMKHVIRFQFSFDGFSVVAAEVYQLAEHARQSTQEIRGLMRNIQVAIREAFTAMGTSQEEVKRALEQAGEAGDSLNSIMQAVQDVDALTQQSAAAAQKMQQASNQILRGIDNLHAVVQSNSRAAEDMHTNFLRITQAFEAVASLSQENSAAVEEVSASTEEMHAQIQELDSAAEALSKMSAALEGAVSQFAL